MKTRYRLRGLLRRQFAASRAAAVLLVVIVLVTAGLLAAWPRSVAQLFTADLQATVAAASANSRSLTAVESGLVPIGPPEDPQASTLSADALPVWGAMDDSMAQVRAALPQPLRSVVGEGHYIVRAGESIQVVSKLPERVLGMELGYTYDPHLDAHIELVEGRKPVPAAQIDPGTGRRTSEEPVEIFMSASTAEGSKWKVGEQRTVAFGANTSFPVELVGIFEPKDPAAPFWEMSRGTLDPLIIEAPSGDGYTIDAQVYLHPASFTALPVFEPFLWYPINSDALSAENAAQVLRQLTAIIGAPQPFSDAGTTDATYRLEVDSVAFASATPEYLQESVSRAATMNQILAMLAAGPLGACLAALALAARMLLDRRASTLVLASARGASKRQLHGSMAVEGLLLGVPAAALAVLAAITLIPGPVTAAQWVPPLLIALVPAVLLGFVPVHGSLRGSRADLNPRARNRVRIAAEAAVLILAGLSVYLLFQRGIGRPGTVEVDLLLAATPLLLALATCVLVLRLYPLPLTALARRQRRKATVIGFLGSIRTLRSPGGGLIPVLALVVGLAVVVFSGVLLATLRDGAETSARFDVAADLRINGPGFDDEGLEELSQLEGVEALTGVSTVSSSTVLIDDRRFNARIMVADLAELAEVQQDYPGSIPASALARATEPVDGTLPIIASTDLELEDGQSGSLLLSGEAEFTVVATAAPLVNFTVSENWILVDQSLLGELAEYMVSPNSVFVGVAPGTDIEALTAQLESMDPLVSVTTVADAMAEVQNAPTVRGLQLGLLVVMLFMGALCALIVVMTSVVGAPARNKLIGLLRTLGFAKRHDRALLLWEIGPIAIAGVAAGVVLGLLLPQLVAAGVDLTAFTTGQEQPPVRYDPLLLAALIGGFIVVVLLAVAGAIAAGRRQRLASVIRIGEEV